MTNNLRDKPVHELCVDKTSCRAEQRGDKSTPTYDLTSDSIKKKMEQSKPESTNDTNDVTKP